MNLRISIVIIGLAACPPYEPAGNDPTSASSESGGGESTTDMPTGTNTASSTAVEDPTTTSSTSSADTPTTEMSLSVATEMTAESSTASTTEGPAVCGDGLVEGDEECDDANQDDHDVCTNACTLATCGDGILGPGEGCDAGGESPECDVDCTSPTCGDSVVNVSTGEACDDGNLKGGACSQSCELVKIVDIGAGYNHTCVTFEDGGVRCWGWNVYGQLGYGNVADLGDHAGELPTPTVDLGGEVIHTQVGHRHTCAALGDKRVKCWGLGSNGMLGYGSQEDLGDEPNEMPPPEVAVGVVFVQVATGLNHTCGRTTAGTVRCWGYNFHGQLGYENTVELGGAPDKLPLVDVPGINDVAVIVAQGFGTCVLSNAGAVRCWGLNDQGQLGLGHTEWIGNGPGEMPPPPVNLGGPVAQLASGVFHNCALMQDGNVRCWGDGTHGELGYGNTKSIGDGAGEMPPPDVDLGDEEVKQVVAGEGFSCAVFVAGNVKCWGSGAFGSLGYGNTSNIGDGPEEMPPDDVALGGAAMFMAAKGHSPCALLADFSLRCWGENLNGKLGYGHTMTIGDDETPAAAGPVPF